MRLAAIDIGTVTTRLLVADVDPGGLTDIVRSTDITHLGENLSATGELSAAAMERVAEVIGRYRETMDELGVEAWRAVATSASRDAANGTEFLALLADRGVRPEIIEGTREAYLSFLGATRRMAENDVLVVDLGGGSTELVLGSAHGEGDGRVVEVAFGRSVDVGSKRLTELFLHSDPPTAAQLDAARAFAATELRPYFDALRDRPHVMVAVAGTATSVATVDAAMVDYDPEAVHGMRVSGAALSDVLGMLSAMTLAERRGVVGLHPDRAPVIIAGVLILEVVLGLAGLDSFVVSDDDILQGILLDTYRDLQKRVEE